VFFSVCSFKRGPQRFLICAYVQSQCALPGTFTVTLTVSGSAGVYLAMTVDEFNYASGARSAIDGSGRNAQAAATSMSLASALTVSGIDLIYAAGS
jgi:hypothetical protein